MGRWRDPVRKEGEGGEDPENGEDAGETVVEEGGRVARASEFSGGDGGDDDAADNKEDVDAKIAVAEEMEMTGGEMIFFDAVDVGEDDQESGESATDLNADDSAGLGF